MVNRIYVHRDNFCVFGCLWLSLVVFGGLCGTQDVLLTHNDRTLDPPSFLLFLRFTASEP